MKRYKIAAVIIILHGIIEIGGFFSVLPVWIFDIEPLFEIPSADFVFAGLVWGTLRIIGGVGLLKNRMWGLVFSVINCATALAMMMTLLPFGIMDGILAGSAIILILTEFFGKKKITD
jgi:hypothetical protein